jgi:hypothetical protein
MSYCPLFDASRSRLECSFLFLGPLWVGPPGLVVYLDGRATPLGLAYQGPHKFLPMCSRLLGRLPADETPVCLGVAVRACLLVLLCCAHLTEFLTRYLLYLVYPTVVPSVRYTSSTLSNYRSSSQPDVAGMM